MCTGELAEEEAAEDEADLRGTCRGDRGDDCAVRGDDGLTGDAIGDTMGDGAVTVSDMCVALRV